MPTAILVGVGGTGAACVEASLHLAALGYLSDRWNAVLPICIDFDSAHPRILGASAFVKSYRRVRGAKALSGGFLHPVLHDMKLIRPAEAGNLRGLFALSPGSPQELLAGLFLGEHVLGEYGGQEFLNGLYGECSVGACFFSSGRLRERLREASNTALNDQGSRIVLFGSFFGGTGAAGLLPVAEHFRRLAPGVPRAIVALEPYFIPDPTEAEDEARRISGPVNLPLSFGRRLQTAYRHQVQVADHPAGHLYIAGTRHPVPYPRGWFRRDQQNNPPHFLEYLGVAFAGQFLECDEVPIGLTYIPATPVRSDHADDPARGLRDAFWIAAVVRRLLTCLVMPAIAKARGRKQHALEGHPWLAETIQALAAGGMVDASDQHHSPESLAMERLENHASGVSELLDFVLQRAGVDKTTEFWSDEQRREVCMRSFPRRILPNLEDLSLSELLPREQFDPLAILRSYRKEADLDAPLRALFRWARPVTSNLDREWTMDPASKEQRLLVRQGSPWRDDPQVVVAIPGDGPTPYAAGMNVLRHLSNGKLDPPFDVDLQRRGSEYASIWGHALGYRENLWEWIKAPTNTAGRNDALAQHLGLIWVALMSVNGKLAPPAKWYSTGTPDSDLGLAIRSTFPGGPFQDLFSTQEGEEGVLALLNPWSGAGDLLGLFFPSVLVVPSPVASQEVLGKLRELGSYGAKAFARQLQPRFAEWGQLTAAWHPDGANSPWPTLMALFLARSSAEIEGDGNPGHSLSLAHGVPPFPQLWLCAAYSH